MRKLVAVVAIAGAMLFVLAGTSTASSFKGTLFHDGGTIRTVVIWATGSGA